MNFETGNHEATQAKPVASPSSPSPATVALGGGSPRGGESPSKRNFSEVLADHHLAPLRRRSVRTLQVNVGKLCNQACHHCHVEAGPKRTEIMTAATAQEIVARIAASPRTEVLDLTGGAPELCPSFRYLVESARDLGLRVLVRCNLTVIYEADMQWLPRFYADNRVNLVCSLPCYTEANVEQQRGKGVFGKSIAALQTLNALGYGRGVSGLELDLVYNPVGAFLPPPQAELEAKYREELRRMFSIDFNRLFTITNMPIKRFAEQLTRSGGHAEYMGLLVNHFNPATVEDLMCRDMLSVGWDGALYDCDFNQMLEISALPSRAGDGAGDGRESKENREPREARNVRRRPTVFDLESFDAMADTQIRTGSHCFGCTAGAGSSCGGELAGGGPSRG